MSKMFEDNVLLSYSLQGFKKKKSFQKLGVYQLLIGYYSLLFYYYSTIHSYKNYFILICFFIDAIRVHPKFKSTILKEFDVPLATWLAHAKFRLTNKNTEKK